MLKGQRPRPASIILENGQHAALRARNRGETFMIRGLPSSPMAATS